MLYNMFISLCSCYGILNILQAVLVILLHGCGLRSVQVCFHKEGNNNIFLELMLYVVYEVYNTVVSTPSIVSFVNER